MSQAFACCLETHCIKRMGTFDSDAWAVKAERLLCSSFFDTAEEDVSDVRVAPLSFFFFLFHLSLFSFSFFVSDVRVAPLSSFCFLFHLSLFSFSFFILDVRVAHLSLFSFELKDFKLVPQHAFGESQAGMCLIFFSI